MQNRINFLLIIVFLVFSCDYKIENNGLSFRKNKSEIGVSLKDEFGNRLYEFGDDIKFYVDFETIRAIEVGVNDLKRSLSFFQKIEALNIDMENEMVYKVKWQKPSPNIESVGRAFYYYLKENARIYILMNYCKNEIEELSNRNCTINSKLNKELFDQLKLSNRLFELQDIPVSRMERAYTIVGNTRKLIFPKGLKELFKKSK